MVRRVSVYIDIAPKMPANFSCYFTCLGGNLLRILAIYLVCEILDDTYVVEESKLKHGHIYPCFVLAYLKLVSIYCIAYSTVIHG